ncbi:hypothetical protein D3C71_1094200 [compost metagenome]
MSHVWTSQAVMAALHRLVDSTDQLDLADIVRESGLERKQVISACDKLVSHAFLSRQQYSDGKVKPGKFKLTPEGRIALEAGANLKSGPKGPSGKARDTAGSLREKVWRLLRIRQKASVPEVVALLCDGEATTQTVERTTDNVQKYLRALRATGYLVEMRREPGTKPTSNGFKRYLLVRDTGPLAPTRRGKDCVYDPNEEREYDVLA